MKLITLYAKRDNKTGYVYIKTKEGELMIKFPPTGYRPTKATKTVTINCWKWKLEWIN